MNSTEQGHQFKIWT